MKSLGLTLTMLTLTGALIALDLSGAHPVSLNANVTRSAPARGLAATLSKPDPTQAAKQEEDDEPDAELFNAFLVTPRSASTVSAAANTAPATLRYD